MRVLLSQKASKSETNNGIDVAPGAWRPNYQLRKMISLKLDGKDVTVAVEHVGPKVYRVKVGDEEWQEVEAWLREGERGVSLTTVVGGQRATVGLLTHESQLHVYDEEGQTIAELPRAQYGAAGASDASSDSACSPTPGVLERILVNQGDKVVKGQPLFVVIAMKMEYVVRASRDGVVAGLGAAKPGDAVGKGAEVVLLEPDTAAD